MIKMVFKRLAGAIPNIIGVVIVTFILTRALPGDPAAYFAGPSATTEAIEQVRASLGLDKPLPHQFALYLRDLAKGNLGNSLSTGQPVLTEIRQRLPASLELTLCGLLLAVVVAIPLGVLAATRPGSWVDHLCRLLATAGVSLPTFFTGLLLAYVFYFLLGIAPAPLGRIDVSFSPPPAVTGMLLVDSLLVQIHTYNDKPIGLVFPPHVEITVTSTEAGARGDTASGSVTKVATLETGMEIRVPLFIKEGEKIKVHTESREFSGRA